MRGAMAIVPVVSGSGESGCGAVRVGVRRSNFYGKGDSVPETEKTHLRICGRNFLVFWDERLREGDHQGEISFRTEEIRLCPTVAVYRHRAQSTLLHELIEAAITYSEIKMEHDDITRLATMMYAILEDNGLHRLSAAIPPREDLFQPKDARDDVELVQPDRDSIVADNPRGFVAGHGWDEHCHS